MYTYETRVGFSQVDKERVMKMDSLLALFQDVTCFQGEEIGVGFDYLEPRKQAWILNAWQIEIKRFPQFNERVTVGTFPTGFKSFIGTRNFILKDAEEEVLVMANSIWTFMDMEKMRPTKVEENILQKYELEEPLSMDYPARKIVISDTHDWDVSEKDAIVVNENYLDSNMHVNNGQYMQMAERFFSKDIGYNRVRVEYRNQAHLGDIIIPVVYEKENVCIITLCDTEKNPYAVIEVSKK